MLTCFITFMSHSLHRQLILQRLVMIICLCVLWVGLRAKARFAQPLRSRVVPHGCAWRRPKAVAMFTQHVFDSLSFSGHEHYLVCMIICVNLCAVCSSQQLKN